MAILYPKWIKSKLSSAKILSRKTRRTVLTAKAQLALLVLQQEELDVPSAKLEISALTA